MAVSLSEVLEVRGSGLTEVEAWMLLNELVSQITEKTISSQIIQPDGLVFYSDGALSINNMSPGKELFCELEDYEEIGSEYGSKEEKYVPISGDLISILDTMMSQDAGFGLISEVRKRCKAKLAGRRTDSPSRHFKDFYRSIFGNMIKIHRPVIQEKSVKSESTMTEHSPPKLAQIKYGNPTIAEEHLQQTMSNSPDTHLRKRESSRHAQEEGNQHDTYFLTPTSRRLARRMNGSDVRRPHSVTNQQSMLKNKDPPVHIRFHANERGQKDLTKVAVEFVNQKRLVVTLNSQKMNCGILLDSAVTHLVGASDSSLFALSVFIDGEYIFVRNESKVNKIITAFGIAEEPRFCLRLKFMPHDASSYGDENFLRAIYLQTRKDILDGRVLCRQDQALHLTAYALHYESESMEDIASFAVGDYVPAGILQRTGTSNAKTLVLQLHAQLDDLTPLESRKQYLLKARELSDFGTNFCIIYWNYHPESVAWLGVSSQGVNLFELKQCEIRKKVHSFTWDQLIKIGYKGTCVSLATKARTKCKFYVKNPNKAKYVVGIVGVTHRFYRFDDCHPNELLHQFHHLDDLKNNGHLRAQQEYISIPKRREGSFILPFKRVPTKREVAVPQVQARSPPRTKSPSQPSSVEEAEDASSEVFSSTDLPEIIPYAPTEDSATSLDLPITSAREVEDDIHPLANGKFPVEVIVHETASMPSYSTAAGTLSDVSVVSSPDEELVDELVASARSEKDHLLLGGSTFSLAERSCVILLEKKDGTFGFSIMGGADKPTSVIKVHHIVEGGAADMNGNLHKGDVILAINDIPLHEVTHKRAVEILSNAPTKSTLTLLKRGSSSLSLHAMTEPLAVDTRDTGRNVMENVSDEEQDLSVHPAPEERLLESYDDRVLQVASAFYNDQYTDLEPSFQHAYIGSGGEDISFAGAVNTSAHEEVASRGEGDGVSTLSAQDHGLSHVHSPRDSGTESAKNEDEIFTAATQTIANFEEFRRRMSGLQQANKSSENSEDTESWTTVDT